MREVGKAPQLITVLVKSLETTPDKVYELKEHKGKRTLTQNAYYWSLIGKTARALRITNTELHNRMLRDVADVETFSGKKAVILLPDNEDTERKALRSETVHLKPTGYTQTEKDGTTYRAYHLLKGSSAMNTEEMGALLDNLITEAKQVGVETLTWPELQEMRQKEKRREERNAQKHNAEPA